MAKIDMRACTMCPRGCMADRKKYGGVCMSGIMPKLARAALYYGEEPCISGKEGSGAIFFSGCSLGCVFCQNDDISHKNNGKEISIERLADIFRELEEQGANNINLVNPTHFSFQIIQALDIYKPKIPVIYNCGGYEKLDTLKALNGYIDVYLPDIKYSDHDIAKNLSGAQNYPDIAFDAVEQMLVQVGNPIIDDRGMIKSGVIIRHMVIPLHMKNSFGVMELIKKKFGAEVWLSILFQYTPIKHFIRYTELNRGLTKREMSRIEAKANELGFINGYIQETKTVGKEYIPEFNMSGL